MPGRTFGEVLSSTQDTTFFFGGSGSASAGRLEVLTVTLPAQEEQAPARQE